MATFLTDLWESIFTPGPTPTLLLATNASFAALQLLFLTLLIATHSIHFVVLSLLCVGLWWAINWFSGEIAAAQRAEEEAKRIREARRSEGERKGDKEQGDEGDAMDTGDDTEGRETEVERAAPGSGSGDKGKASARQSSQNPQYQQQQPKSQPPNTSAHRAPRPETQSTVFVQRPSETEMREMRESTPHASASGSATTGAKLTPATAGAEAVKKRRGVGAMGESTGDLSTDSEWEKLSQEG